LTEARENGKLDVRTNKDAPFRPTPGFRGTRLLTLDRDSHMNGNCTRLISASALLSAVLLVPSPALEAGESTNKTETTTLTGLLVDDGGHPIRGAKLTVLEAWTQQKGHRELATGGGSGISDAAGRIKIENVPTERILLLRFSHPDFPRYWFEATTAKDPSPIRKLTLWEIVANNFRKGFSRPQNVKVKLVGNDGQSPMPGVVIRARPAPDSDQSHLPREFSASSITDRDGFARLLLSAGRYELSLGNDHPLDCIGLNETRLGVGTIERTQTFLRMTRRGADVVFRAIDADSHQPIAGVSFWREMPGGEYWFEAVRSETVGSDLKGLNDEEARKPPYVTDKEGSYRCQMCAALGWTYHVHHRPDGYDEVDPQGQTFDIPEEGTVTRIFYLRKHAKEKSKAN
jgi:hypothetical protein